MGAFALKNHKGYTLIELLAVMAIVSVLAGIVSVSVGGSGETSRDTQTKQDATTVESAAADFFSDQVAAETLTAKTVSVFDQDGIRQVKSSRWPEEYIATAYSTVFPEENLPTNIVSIIFLDTDGALSDLRIRGLLQRFNAVDFDALLDGGFMVSPPDNVDNTTEGFSNYLWLLERDTAAGGSGDGASRKVAVFKLLSVEKSEISDLVDLTYQRIVGSDFSDELPAASAQNVTTNEDTPKEITLAGIDSDTCELTFVIDLESVEGSLTNVANNPCVPGEPNADSASVTYTPELDFNGFDGFSYIVIDGNGDDIANITVLINVVNDAPIGATPIADVNVNEDAVDSLIDLSTAFSDVDIDTNSDSLTYSVTSNNNPTLVTATPAANILVLDYLPDQNGSAQITVQAADGSLDFAEDTFIVIVDAVNDQPSFTIGVDQNVQAADGAQSVAGWATAISRGSTVESGQLLTFDVSNDNNALFSVQPTVLPDGTLTYTPAINADGSASVTVAPQDDGGTPNGGFDTSPPQTFLIEVAGGLFLSSCATLDIPGATYELVTDLAATGGCFTVTADNITLEGNGHSLVGDGVVATPNSTSSRGVFLTSVTGATAKNLDISNFNVGVYLGRNGNTHSGIFSANDLTTGNILTENTFGAESCQDIRDANPGAGDGDYAISPNSQTFTVYCHNMTGTPSEYLTLANTGGNFNYGQYTAGGASPGSNVRTNYTKVRLNPATLTVNTGDQVFSSLNGELNHSGGSLVVKSMPYGTAMGCNGSANGTANIDLTGTPFAVNDTFTPGGAGPSGSATFSSNDQVVQVTGGGFCGWNGPNPTIFNPVNITGTFSLNLTYLGAISSGIGVYAANSDGNNEIYNNNFLADNTVFNGSLELHYKPLPIGGNFWSANTACIDANANGTCDVAFGLDILPWIIQDGWLTPPVITSEVVSWWPGDGNGNDIVGLNDGTLVNGVAFVAGKVGHAFSFDGVDDHVSVPNNATLDFGTGDFSIDAWVKIESTAPARSNRIVDRLDVDHGWAVDISFNGKGSCFVDGPGGTIQGSVVGTGNLKDGVFHHIACVREGGVLKLFVDGALEDQVSGVTGDVSVPVDLFIGARRRSLTGGPPRGALFFQGVIDEVKIYSRALASQEILAIASATLDPPSILTTCGDTLTSNAILVADLDCTGTTGNVVTIGANNV